MVSTLKTTVCALVMMMMALTSFAQGDDARGQAYYLLDTSGTHVIEEVIRLSFEPVEDGVANLGLRAHPVWMRVDLDKLSAGLFFELQAANVDSIYFYQVSEERILQSDTTGEAYALSTRQVPLPNFLFALQPSDAPTQVYLRLVSGKQLLLPYTIDEREELFWNQNRRDIFFALYGGIIFVMFLYNLFIWFSVRDRNYLWYVLYIFFVGLTQLVLNGYGNVYFWPENQWLAVRSAHFCGVLSGITTVIFAQAYLHIKEYTKWLYYLLNFYVVVYIAAALLTFVGNYVMAYQLINFCALAAFLLVFGAINSLRKGYRPAGYFLIAWSIFLLGVTVFVLRDLGILPYNLATQYALPIGSALEVVLLSFALADRINQLKREKEKEQEAKLSALKENERIITQQNVLLEAKVDERTRELAQSNEELNTTLSDLRSAQAQLVDAEKMASLGQMTAGIAHELNNPINFVSSNIDPLRRDLEDIFSILEAYQNTHEDGASTQESLEAARKMSADLELDYLKTEIDQLLKGISDGASRTAEIVKGLRIFSRLDEDALKKADINECLRSTLVILKSAIKSDAPVEVNLEENLPEIMCYPGKLNQVFMNIIVNALQATAATGKPYNERLVKVQSKVENSEVIVRISDNGVGMPEKVKMRIFDPFFTTKNVGQGTGLGLSIVLGIINDHNGTVEVESREGEGTDFIITLPKDHKN